MSIVTVTKTVLHNGIEVRRSNELTAANASVHSHPMQWVVDVVGSKWGFKTLKLAQQFIDGEIVRQSTQVYTDFCNFWIVRPVDGRFTQVAISREEWKARKEGAK
jgi:hypothetical protein